MALKYTYDITNMTATIWNSMSATAKQAYIKKFVDDLIKNEGTNADFWLSAGFPQGAVIIDVSTSDGFDIRLYYSPTSYVSMFNIYKYSSGAPCWLKTATNIPLYFSHFAYSFTTPIKSLEIPKPDVAVTKYIQFMDKTSLYNSYVKNVNAELVKKQSVQVITDFIFGIFKNLTDGMVIYDYYQWQGLSLDGNTELRMYKQFYLRVFGKVGNDLVSKSIPIDYHLFAGIAGATLLDNGIMIAGNALTDKAGTYIRRGYMIHGNNCDLQSLIDKIQQDNNFSLTPIEFPDYQDIKEQLAENKAFLGRDGKTVQQRFNDSLTGYRDFYSGMKSLLGLTDSQVEFFAQRDAQRDTKDIIDSQSLALSAEMSTQNAEVQKQQYNQSQADEIEKQSQKEEAKAEKESQKALQVEKNKQINADYIKKAYQSYTSAIKKVSSMTGQTATIPTYTQFVGNFSSLGTNTQWSFDLVGTVPVASTAPDSTGKFLVGYKFYYKSTVKDSNKDGVIDSLSIDPLVITAQYAIDSGASADSEKVAYSDDGNIKNNDDVTNADIPSLTTTQTEEGFGLGDVATAVLALTSRFNAFTAAFSFATTTLNANEDKQLEQYYKENELAAQYLAEIKAKNANDKLIPQYLEKLSNKNFSGGGSTLNLDLTPLDQRLEAMTAVHQKHYDEYKERENKRVEREKIAHTDWHGKETEESITLRGVKRNGAPVVLDLPQGYFGRLKKSGFYQKQAEELYDVESDNQAGNGMSKVKGSGQSSFKIDTTKEIKHITGEEYEIAKEFGEFENISKVAEGYQATVQKWIDDSWVDGEYSPE